MRNKTFLIIIDVCFILCVVLCAAGAGAFVYLLRGDSISVDEGVFGIACVVLIQNAVFFLAGVVVLIYAAAQKKARSEPDAGLSFPYVSKLTVLKESGDVKSEYQLANKKALIIGKSDRDESELEYSGSGGALKHEYAVLNLEKNYWYIEAVSESYGVGIRKEHDGIFRRLRTGKPCLVGKNDVLEIAGERIIVR